jgi:hypothetical protein
MMNPITAQALGAARLADMHRAAARRRVRRWVARAERAARAQTFPATRVPAEPSSRVQPGDVPDEHALCLSGVPKSALS